MLMRSNNLFENTAAKRSHAPNTQTADFNNYLYASNDITKILGGRVGMRTLEYLYATNYVVRK